MQCNGDMRHVIEILAIIFATAVFYRETKRPRVTSIESDRTILKILNTPWGWAIMMSVFLIVALPAYVYLDKNYKRREIETSLQTEFSSTGTRLFLKTMIVFFVCFYLTYKQ